MNITAFNCLMTVLCGVLFNIWFWAINTNAGNILLIMLVIWALGNLTKGKRKIKA